MGRRAELEHEVSMAGKRLKKAPKDTPEDLRQIWEDQFVGLSLDLNPFSVATNAKEYDK